MHFFPSHQSEDMSGTATRKRKRASSGSGGRTWLLGTAAVLAASALFVRQRTREAEAHHPPAGSFVEIDGIRLHYIEQGQGQPLVLVHGGGSMIQDFQLSGLVEMAARKYRVIVFDRPGYGYSERPRTTLWTPQAQAALLQRALHQLGVEQPIVLGHSWGALVAVALALDFPDDVKSLVLASGYYYPTPRVDVAMLSGPAIPGIGDLMSHTISPLIGRLIWPLMMRRIFGPQATPQRFRDGFPVWMALRPSQLRASAADLAWMIPATMSMQERYHELLLPVAIVAGDRDLDINTQQQSERLHSELPQSSLHIVRGAGHMVHHQAPQKVMAAIDHAAVAEGAVPSKLYTHVFPAPAQIN